MAHDTTGQTGRPVYIIAEAGVNHNGSLETAHKLVCAAARAGVDAVKFQSFKAERVAAASAGKAAYQQQRTDAEESQLAMLRKLELSDSAHGELATACRELGIDFLSTAFDCESLDFLVERFDPPRLKIASGELTHAPLLYAHARTGKPLILSTGMATPEEIERALAVLACGMLEAEKPNAEHLAGVLDRPEAREALSARVTLLHCTSEYPAPVEALNLRVIPQMRERFALPVGYSDHSEGIHAAVAAVALGACVVEKHFTLDRNQPGPDHAASLEPDALEALVTAVRFTETALGEECKSVASCELGTRAVARRSLVAARPIELGEVFSETNLCCKRPGTGVSAMEYWNYLGKKASRCYEQDECIDE